MPKRLDTYHGLKFLEELHEIPESKQYLFDFRETGFSKPFGTLIVASGIRKFVKERKASCQATSFQHLTYPAQMGFFKHIGLGWGKEPGEASGNSDYQPITTISVGEIRRRAFDLGVDIGDVVEDDARNLATILCRNVSASVVETLTYALREIIRNVIEHSQAADVIFSAQFFQRTGIVEIAVVDEGVGLRQALSRNPHLSPTSDEKALTMAMLPGVSGANWPGKKIKFSRGHWDNSGFGLYMTSRLCSDGGSFALGSGSAALRLAGGAKSTDSTQISGTAVCMELNTAKLGDTSRLLAAYAREGAELAIKLGNPVIETRLSASIMLSEYFRKKK